MDPQAIAGDAHRDVPHRRVGVGVGGQGGRGTTHSPGRAGRGRYGGGANRWLDPCRRSGRRRRGDGQPVEHDRGEPGGDEAARRQRLRRHRGGGGADPGASRACRRSDAGGTRRQGHRGGREPQGRDTEPRRTARRPRRPLLLHAQRPDLPADRQPAPGGGGAAGRLQLRHQALDAAGGDFVAGQGDPPPGADQGRQGDRESQSRRRLRAGQDRHPDRGPPSGRRSHRLQRF